MRHVFFSFHFDDAWRVNQVRNMGVVSGVHKVGFRDKAHFEQVKRRGDAAVKKWIDKQMHGTSVTVVLVGTHTYRRPFVRYEIKKTLEHRKGLLAIHINGLKDKKGNTKRIGKDPLIRYKPHDDGYSYRWWNNSFDCYDPSEQDLGGESPFQIIKDNIADWIEDAAQNSPLHRSKGFFF